MELSNDLADFLFLDKLANSLYYNKLANFAYNCEKIDFTFSKIFFHCTKMHFPKI